MRRTWTLVAACLLAGLLSAAAVSGATGGLSASESPKAAGPALSEVAGPKHTDAGRDYYKAEGFSFVPAEGWEKQAMPPAGFFMMYTNPPAKMGNVPTLTATVNTIHLDNVDEIMAKVKETLKASATPATIVEEGKLTINGRAAFYLSSTFTAGGKERRNLQYFIIGANKKMYILTIGCLPNTLAPLRPAAEKMAMSIVTD